MGMDNLIVKLTEIAGNDPTSDLFYALDDTRYSAAEIDQMEKELEVRFPGDYREILERFGGGNLAGPESTLIFFNKDELYSVPDYSHFDKLGPIFVIGTDNGGHFYFYNLVSQRGYDPYSVFLVYPGALTWSACRYLSEVIEKIIAGEAFASYPMLR
jgi:hypothetical protein